MKKIIVLFGIAALAVAPAVAKSKPKKSQQDTEAAEIARQHDNTLRALRDGLPLVLPSWSLPVYFAMHKDAKDVKARK